MKFARTRMFGSLFLFAAAIRSIGYATVFTPVGVQLPYAGDAYYHLRRIWFSVARFPESLSFDRYVSFPEGSQIIWPATFDVMIAALIRPFVDPGDQAAVEALAVWFPVLLGATTTAVVGLFAARFYGPRAGWLAGLIHAVLPMGFIFSQLGMIDHHVAVALLTTVMLWNACEIFSHDERIGTWRAAFESRNTRLAAILGLVTAGTILTWTGALIHAGILQLAFVARWLLASDRRAARSRAVEFAVAQTVTALCLTPFCLAMFQGTTWREFGTWSALVLSNLQPTYFAMAGATVAGVQWLHERLPLGRSRPRRIVSAVGLATLGVAVCLAALPALRNALLLAGGWFSDSERLLGLAAEMRPLLAASGHLDPTFAFERLGTGLLVLPFVWIHLVRRAWRTGDAAQGLVLFWALALFGLSLRQWRFGNTLSVVYAVLIGAVLADWLVGLRSRFADRPLRPLLESLVVLALVISSLLSFADFYRPIVRMNHLALEDEGRRALGPLHPARRIYDEAGRWLAAHTPPTSGYLDPDEIPEYAVLADWSTGHLLRYRSERPMVQDNFGPYAGHLAFDLAWRYFAETDEEAAIGILDRLGARYLLSGPMGAGRIDGLDRNAMAIRLWSAFGSFRRFREGDPVPGLARHRLIFHADTLPADRPRHAPTVPAPFTSLGIWEVVPGAAIEGTAEPDTLVRLRLGLATSSGARHVYRRRTRANRQGHYRFVVPYPTGSAFSPDVRVEGPYRLESSGLRGRARVSEEDVLTGATIQGPDLRVGRPLPDPPPIPNPGVDPERPASPARRSPGTVSGSAATSVRP